MTREQQIYETAMEYCRPKHEMPYLLQMSVGFIDGAKWADQNPKEGLVSIEKAVEWVKNNKHLHKELSFGSLSINWDKFIKEFRKAMEE